MNTSENLNPKANPSVLDDLFIDNQSLLASIDLGSNSFHLAVARLDRDEIRKVLSLSDKVQLAAGLDGNGVLSDEAMKRGLDCLANFKQYLDAVATDKIRIVATNALRKAVNRDEFIKKANDLLPVPIEVIAGREEARLIYLGVSHTNASTAQRLVIDIGGGSTEFIIGQGFEPIETESLQMGCVAFTKKFFLDGKITQKAVDNAMSATQTELLAIAKRYKKTGWDNVIGSSGTIKATNLAIIELGFGDFITLNGVKKLLKYLINLGTSDKIVLNGVKPHRRAVFVAGVAELYAIMIELGIDKIEYSDGALREGVMYDMLGRLSDEDVRDRSVLALMARYSVSQKQANLVASTAIRLFDKNKHTLLLSEQDGELLAWAAKLHEIGLAISHSSYHEHSAYLLKFSDIFGFSKAEQDNLSFLARYHRRKIKEDVSFVKKHALLPLLLILRLSVIAYQSRSRHSAVIDLTVNTRTHWQVSVKDGNHKSLIIHQLYQEIGQFDKVGVTLVVN